MTEVSSFLTAAEKVLAEDGEPMHYRKITRIALETGILVTKGKTPEASLNARISVDIKERGRDSLFLRTAPGVFALRRWLDDGSLRQEDLHSSGRAMVPHYPSYPEVRAVLSIWEGAPDGAITRMNNAIWSHTGTPQDQTDWSDPDTWIQERLEGEARDWATQTWLDSQRKVSPRYVVGHWLLINNAGLLELNKDGRLRLTATGTDFLKHPEGETVRQIDLEQGLLRLLRLMAEAGTASQADLLAPWSDFLLRETNVRAESSRKSYLSRRLKNLLQREYIERSGRSYAITGRGLRYLESAPSAVEESESRVEADLGVEIRKLQERLRQQVRDDIKSLLMEMDPYAFEELVQRLLDAMGYQVALPRFRGHPMKRDNAQGGPPWQNEHDASSLTNTRPRLSVWSAKAA